MPTYQVLRCYEDSCRMFQVHQVKKVNKWQCRVCGEKQSTIKVFLTSPQASECRTFVQNMNMARGRAEEDLLNQRQSREEDQAAVPQRQECRLPTRSKWEDYVDEEPDDETGEHDDQGGSSLPQQPWQGGKRMRQGNPAKDFDPAQHKRSKPTASLDNPPRSNRSDGRQTNDTPTERPAKHFGALFGSMPSKPPQTSPWTPRSLASPASSAPPMGASVAPKSLSGPKTFKRPATSKWSTFADDDDE